MPASLDAGKFSFFLLLSLADRCSFLHRLHPAAGSHVRLARSRSFSCRRALLLPCCLFPDPLTSKTPVRRRFPPQFASPPIRGRQSIACNRRERLASCADPPPPLLPSRGNWLGIFWPRCLGCCCRPQLTYYLLQSTEYIVLTYSSFPPLAAVRPPPFFVWPVLSQPDQSSGYTQLLRGQPARHPATRSTSLPVRLSPLADRQSLVSSLVASSFWQNQMSSPP